MLVEARFNTDYELMNLLMESRKNRLASLTRIQKEEVFAAVVDVGEEG